jgi:hypothetical protein
MKRSRVKCTLLVQPDTSRSFTSWPIVHVTRKQVLIILTMLRMFALRHYGFLGFETLTAIATKSTIFKDVSLVEVHRSFGRTYCIHLQGESCWFRLVVYFIYFSTLYMEAVRLFRNVYKFLTARRHIPHLFIIFIIFLIMEGRDNLEDIGTNDSVEY